MVSLNATLERDLRAGLAMATRSSNPMLAVWAGRFRVALEARRRPRPPPSTLQLALWIVRPDGEIEAWRGRLPPGASVRCDHFACLLPLRTYLERQGATWPGGNRWKNGTVKAKKAGIHEFCE